MDITQVKATIVYDGECNFCKRCIEWLKKHDIASHFDYLPCQSTMKKERFPQIKEENCLKAMYIVFQDGRFYSGGDAIPRIMSFLPRWKQFVFLFKIPATLILARLGYQIIARNRRRLNCHENEYSLKEKAP